MSAQLALIEDTDQRIRDAASEWGITRLTIHASRISTRREDRQGGASGPDLDDYEAAVLIASGVPWGVYQPWRKA